ncbi:4,5-dioxygenase [Vibrio sp. V12_P9A6T4]|uniref:DOPA 4,5-dioxygenase family protein n=1 Tax=Vibrio sp. V12_P9A6T4 TaxID=1938667 RepID=UPI000B8E35AA|nr:DOPA 4,5-dioxygenase family protein [Vibrio sp. V12_P9A6T4]OXX50366.1 4,5-dioxygenase [Vibrio sp. V12_P9A6T4]
MFHAHVYFDLVEQAKAQRVQQKIAQQRHDVQAMFGLVPRLVGPHLKPMFEVHLADNSHGFIEWLDEHREGLSVLIHPVSGDDRYDHSQGQVLWLGETLGVNLAVLR